MGLRLGIIGIPARSFAGKLIRWYARNRRDLPWRRTRDPYRIWVSEIMLQQTRAQTVIPYYQKFLERFPSVQALARAPETEVLAGWSGLGYYSRARNLHRAAQKIVAAEAFPQDYPAIRRLPGVGPYTAAAIASIAFDLPHAVLDGNVMRVIARLANDAADIGSARTRARFLEIAQSLLDPHHPGLFNQALMELGATICLPRAPLCPLCPVSGHCLAFRQGVVSELPVKLRRTLSRKIEATLVLAQRRGCILLWQRLHDSRRMSGFWELPSPEQLPGIKLCQALGVFRHTITHHHYAFTVRFGTIASVPRSFRWFRIERLTTIPLSTTAQKALRLTRVIS